MEPAVATEAPVEAPNVSARFQLIDTWKADAGRLWSMRASIFMFVLVGAVLGLSAFTDVFNPWFFLFLSMCGYGLIGFLRLVKQVPKADIS